MDRARAAVRPLNACADVRGAGDIGRRARLELVFAVRNGRTVLAHGYAEPPLRTGHAFRDADGRGLHFILASSAPGLFGGDTIEQTIRVERGAIVRLTSQSALQLHPSRDNAAAAIAAAYEVAEDAELTCAWDPMIPFAGAAVRQRITIAVNAGGRVSWSDVLMSGREGRGERWAFASFDHELRVHTRVGLAFLERYRLEPPVAPVAAPWQAGGAAYIGTLLRVGFGDAAAAREAAHGALAAMAGVFGAADVPADDLMLVRIVSDTGVSFHRARRAVRDALDGRCQNR